MRNYISVFAAAMLLVLAATMPSCKEHPYYNSPSDNQYNTGSVSDMVWWDDESELIIPEGIEVITVQEAIEICRTLASGQTTTDTYYIKGMVHSIVSKYSSATDGWATFYMVDEKQETNPTFEAFKCYDIDGAKFTSMEQINNLRGSWVVVQAPLTSYNGTPETAQEGSLLTRTYHKVETEGDGTLENPYTIADLIALDRNTAEEVYVRGIIRGCATDNPATQEGLQFQPGEDGGFDKITNIVLADDIEETLIENMVAVELPNRTSIQKLLHLGDEEHVAANLGKEVIVHGKIGMFLGIRSVMKPSEAIFPGDDETVDPMDEE